VRQLDVRIVSLPAVPVAAANAARHDLQHDTVRSISGGAEKARYTTAFMSREGQRGRLPAAAATAGSSAACSVHATSDVASAMSARILVICFITIPLSSERRASSVAGSVKL
jgi:hypothetical protein